jgi:hypothetical protein
MAQSMPRTKPAMMQKMLRYGRVPEKMKMNIRKSSLESSCQGLSMMDQNWISSTNSRPTAPKMAPVAPTWGTYGLKVMAACVMERNSVNMIVSIAKKQHTVFCHHIVSVT